MFAIGAQEHVPLVRVRPSIYHLLTPCSCGACLLASVQAHVKGAEGRGGLDTWAMPQPSRLILQL